MNKAKLKKELSKTPDELRAALASAKLSGERDGKRSKGIRKHIRTVKAAIARAGVDILETPSAPTAKPERRRRIAQALQEGKAFRLWMDQNPEFNFTTRSTRS